MICHYHTEKSRLLSLSFALVKKICIPTTIKWKCTKMSRRSSLKCCYRFHWIAKKPIYFYGQVTIDCLAKKDTLQYIFLSWPETTQKITCVKSRVDSWTTQILVHSDRTVILSSVPSRYIFTSSWFNDSTIILTSTFENHAKCFVFPFSDE